MAWLETKLITLPSTVRCLIETCNKVVTMQVQYHPKINRIASRLLSRALCCATVDNAPGHVQLVTCCKSSASRASIILLRIGQRWPAREMELAVAMSSFRLLVRHAREHFVQRIESYDYLKRM